MYAGIPYGDFFDTPQCRVSIDNVRIKFSYKHTKYDFEKYETLNAIDLYSEKLDRLFYDRCDVKWSYCVFFKIGNYTRTCTISGIDPFSGSWSCAVMIGRYCFDTSCKQVAPEIVFDFNPNKVPMERYVEIRNFLMDGALQVSISRYDVAFDFPIPRDHVTLIANDRQCYKLFRDAQKGTTEYQGERSKHNGMKLYDKTKESALAVPVTRCEITVGGDYTKSLEHLFPVLVVLGDLQLNTGFADLPFQVLACLYHPDMIPILKKSVDHKTWKKYSDMIATHGQRKLTPDNWESVDRYICSRLVQLKGGVV